MILGLRGYDTNFVGSAVVCATLLSTFMRAAPRSMAIAALTGFLLLGAGCRREPLTVTVVGKYSPVETKQRILLGEY